LKLILVIAALIFLFPSVLNAEERTVTLKEAIRLALVNNNLVKAAEYERKAADLGASSSRRRWFPRIFLDETFTSSNSPTRVFMMKLDQGRFTQNDFLINNLNHPASANDFRTAFTLEQPLFDMGIVYGTGISEAEAEEKNLALDGRREDTGFMVFSLYLDAQKARDALDAAEKAVIDAREHVRLAKVRNEAGTGLKSDELRALTFLAEMEQQEITAKNNVILAGLRLSLATGGKAGDSLGIREPISEMPPVLGESEIFSLAMKHRKDLRVMEKVKEKGDIGVKMAGSAFLPTLYGSATYQMNDRNTPFSRDNDSWMVGANLRWELFDGMRRVSDRARAKALRDSAREYLEQQTREIALQVRESLLRRDEAAKRLEVARASCLNADEGLRLIEKRFANSLATMVEVLDAQTALNRSRVNLVETETGYALATAGVLHTAGIFLEEVMK
jgi:outer membrane protein TolC